MPYEAPKRTHATPADVAHAYWVACRELWGADVEAPTIAILMAHSALETGHWKSMWNNNVGNIKAGNLAKPYTCIRLNEVLVRGGRRVVVWFDPALGELASRNGPPVHSTTYELPPGHPQTRMRAYPTLADGVHDKVQFLARQRYRRAKHIALVEHDPGAYALALRAAGYYTADPEPYRKAVVSLYHKYYPVVFNRPALPIDSDTDACVGACARVEHIPYVAEVDWDAHYRSVTEWERNHE